MNLTTKSVGLLQLYEQVIDPLLNHLPESALTSRIQVKNTKTGGDG